MYSIYRLRIMNLNDFFSKHKKVALAFSGGTDSAFLLYSAIKNGADVTAYYVSSPFQPQFELQDAKRLAKELNAKLKIINVNLDGHSEILENSPLRCYYCKKNIFSSLIREAKKDGYSVILDGTNASDDIADRPGFKALLEFGVLSPLRECGLTKDEIRKMSKEVGLFTFNKPSYSCLATRIPTGNQITNSLLNKIERAENLLFALGFSDFRFRIIDDNSAKIQVQKAEFTKAQDLLNKIRRELQNDFEGIIIDTAVFS